MPDFRTDANGYLQSASGSREGELQKAGPERFVLLPVDDQTSLVAGDYYLAVISEGVSPVNDNTIGTGNSSGVLTSNGPLAITNLGTASLAGLTQPVSLAGGQVKAYQFTVPVGTVSLEVRLDNRVGNPWFSLISGTALPQPGNSSDSYANYGYSGGQYDVPVGGVARVRDGNLITVANPPAGLYSLTVNAEYLSPGYPDASANLVIIANAPVPLTFNGGTANVTGQAATAWRYFTVTVPAGVNGWDVRVEKCHRRHAAPRRAARSIARRHREYSGDLPGSPLLRGPPATHSAARRIGPGAATRCTPPPIRRWANASSPAWAVPSSQATISSASITVTPQRIPLTPSRPAASVQGRRCRSPTSVPAPAAAPRFPSSRAGGRLLSCHNSSEHGELGMHPRTVRRRNDVRHSPRHHP